jgi:hypothetical protein
MLESELGWIDWLTATALVAAGLAIVCCTVRAAVDR